MKKKEKKVVTCLAHSNEHFKTSLAEYRGGVGGGVHCRSSYLSDYLFRSQLPSAFTILFQVTVTMDI